MAFDEQLASRVRRILARKRLPTGERHMMGGLCFMVRDKMCVGVEKDRLMVRLDPTRESEALARDGCTPMDFTGRPMRGFVFVARRVLAAESDLAFWVSLALEFNPLAKSSRGSRAKPAPLTRLRTVGDHA